jgi:Zn-dependent protease
MIGFIVWAITIFISITIHELSHAWAADRLGDPTARLSGRLTLNPLAHYDPIGTTLLLVTALLTSFPFGWAKPVPVDPYNLKNPKKDMALVSLAGPAANILLAIILSVVTKLTSNPFTPSLILNFVNSFIIINVSLAIFNLIPVSPLDGGKIFLGLLPDREARQVELFLNHFGLFILLILIFPTFGGTSLISLVISPLINFIIGLLGVR